METLKNTAITLFAVLLLSPVFSSAASRMEGTYTDTEGIFTLDLRSGGKAAFSFMGENYPCTYKVNGTILALDCSPKGEKMDLTIHDDGSLSGPGPIGAMRKSKSDSAVGQAPDRQPVSQEAAVGKNSGLEKAAKDAALAEVMKHWVKGADGWITARDEGTSLAPIRFLRQIRQLTVESVRSYDLSESDRLNGFEWAGEVSFKGAPCREVGDQGLLLAGMASVTVDRRKGRWTQWVDFQPEPVKVQKVKGQWQIHQDTWLLRGKIPTAEDFARAGVKVAAR